MEDKKEAKMQFIEELFSSRERGFIEYDSVNRKFNVYLPEDYPYPATPEGRTQPTNI